MRKRRVVGRIYGMKYCYKGHKTYRHRNGIKRSGQAWLAYVNSCMLVNHGPSQQSSKEEYKPWKRGATARYYISNTKTMLPESPCQDPAGNWTTGRPPNHRKEMQTAVIWSCLLFIRSGQNHLARHSERGKKTGQTEEEVGRHQGMDRPRVHRVPDGSGEQVE